MIDESATALALFAFYGLVLVLYVPFFFYYRRRSGLRFARRRFCRGVLSILGSSEDQDDWLNEVQILFKTLAENYRAISTEFRSAGEMLEELLVLVDTSEEKQFKRTFGVELPKENRAKIVMLLNAIRAKQPFSAISSRKSSLLGMLQHSIDTNNGDLANNSLRQLSDEIEVMESSLRKQENRNRLAFSISLVGVVLTTVFGLASLLQFFAG